MDDRGNLKEYLYTYTPSEKQQVISFTKIGEPASWLFKFDSSDLLVSSSISKAVFDVISTSSDFVLIYPDDQDFRPNEICIAFDNSSVPGTFTGIRRFSLEWEDGNGSSVILDVDRNDGNGFQFEVRGTFSYDNNINPYAILIKEQFGFHPFFATNMETGLKTINFGKFFWQSHNNITKFETFDAPDLTAPTETTEYQYTYTENYYPKSAILKTRGTETFTKELVWSY